MNQPYTYDGPIEDRDRFYGRRSEITRISSRIGADRPQSVSVVGGPRSGKTSLLRWLFHPDSQREYLEDPPSYVYLFLDLTEASPQDPEDFFAVVDRAYQCAGLDAMPATYDGFSGRLSELAEAGRQLVLFCDDFHVITQNDRFPLEFFSFLRSAANNHDVGFVVSSFAPLHKLCASQDLEESPFFNIFTPVNLRPFRADEARELVEDPAERAGAPFGEEVDWILDLAGSHPYLLQLTAALAFEGKADGAIDRQVLAERASSAAEEFFRVLWDSRFPAVQKEVLRALASDQGVEDRIRYAADDLLRDGYLTKADDRYSVASRLMLYFVAQSQNVSIWKRLFGR
jgi:hypothetical protein